MNAETLSLKTQIIQEVIETCNDIPKEKVLLYFKEQDQILNTPVKEILDRQSKSCVNVISNGIDSTFKSMINFFTTDNISIDESEREKIHRVESKVLKKHGLYIIPNDAEL